MVTAINEIKSILQAIGANPAPISDNEIKINAPKINGGNGGTNEKTKDQKAQKLLACLHR